MTKPGYRTKGALDVFPGRYIKSTIKIDQPILS